jgi:nicotinamide-nucleotide amidase
MAGKRTAPDPKLFNKADIEEIRNRLVSLGETIAVAESVTAGLLQAALASAENASQFFQGGITAYNIGQKALQLNVEPIEALACNCVSEKTTSEMALNICIRFRGHWGIGVTGYATPVPESSGKVYAWYAIAHRGKLIEASRINGTKSSPLSIQLQFVEVILARLRKVLSRKNLG